MDDSLLNYKIDAGDLVFTNNPEEGVYSGGFSVNSILMKSGLSPIITMNSEMHGGDKVSDLFNNLVVPNWVVSYGNKMQGGNYKEPDYDSDEDVIDDDLHEKLLQLVKEDNIKNQKPKKRATRKMKNTKRTETKRRK